MTGVPVQLGASHLCSGGLLSTACTGKNVEFRVGGLDSLLAHY
jgi:hypothetical protein